MLSFSLTFAINRSKSSNFVTIWQQSERAKLDIEKAQPSCNFILFSACLANQNIALDRWRQFLPFQMHEIFSQQLERYPSEEIECRLQLLVHLVVMSACSNFNLRSPM